MLERFFNLRNILGLIAIGFVTASIFYSNYLAQKIAADEKRKVEQYIEAQNDLYNINKTDTKLALKIIQDNGKDIPLILTNESDSIISHNYDTSAAAKDPSFLKKKLAELKKINPPVVWTNPLDPSQKNFTYYGESALLVQIKYFPILQLVVALLFIIVILVAITTKNKSTQNQVWAGMAKETAHQLGTPISSLQGWLEMLKENHSCDQIATEMTRDVERLKLVSDRFGKIGSTPTLEETDLISRIESMLEYIRPRASKNVSFTFNGTGEADLPVMLNPPLFDWVIENLLKNALDALNGKGNIDISIGNETTRVIIDVKDSGKGIARANISKVFKPGFTTKQRGWGLGLSLSKRIIERYHKGELYVKQSEHGKGTTFRIVLNK